MINKNIRIVLINPCSPFLINKTVFPPLGLLQLSAVFKKEGYRNIEFYDIEDDKDYSHVKGDVFLIYCATPNVEYAKDIMMELRKNNISAKFCIGGPHATLMPQDLMCFDSIIVGEGEIATLNLLKDYPNIRKIYTEIKINNLDEIPYPDRDIINIREYAKNFTLRGEPTTSIITSRGCSYSKCAFCSQYGLPGSKVRYRSAENIVEEIKEIQNKYDINSFAFFDDEFLSAKKRLREFCEYVKSMNITWRVLTRVESLDKKTVSMIKDAGCVEVAIGIESADQNILNIINKNIDIDKAEKACNIIKDADIDLKELFIVGLPNESRESLQKMDDFVARTQPFDVDFTILSVYPGSDIYEHPEKYPGITFKKGCKGWYKGIPGEYNNLCRINTPYLTFKEIVEWREKLEKKYKPVKKLMVK